MNCIINEIRDTDHEMYNIVRALGPGDGINRMMATMWNSISINRYGPRETVKEFPLAVDNDDLRTKANQFLNEHAFPQQEVHLTYYFNASDHDEPLHFNGDLLSMDGEAFSVYSGGQSLEFNLGDTVRVASDSLGVAFTGTIEEIDWSPGSVDMRIGQDAYNLIDVIRGDVDEEERNKTALGLPAPIGVVAMKDHPGVALKMNPYTNSRAVGVEIYAGTFPGFVADRSTLLEKGGGTRFKFPQLTSGTVFYFKVRSYDNKGEVSEFAPTVAAQAGYIQGGRIEEGTLDITPFASALRPPRNVTTLPDVDLVSGYSPGDMVVYDPPGTTGPRLYELREDPTGDPASDWIMMTPEALEERSVAHQVVAGTVVAGAIGADEIAANAISANKIRAGHVVMGDEGNGDGGLGSIKVYRSDVLQTNLTEQVRMGYIAGKPGVPAGTSYGFWGSMGTGVFIQGAPRVVKANVVYQPRTHNFATDNYYEFEHDEAIISSVNIPPGKMWIMQSSVNYSLPLNATIGHQVVAFTTNEGDPNTKYGVLQAGSYTNVRMAYTIGAYNESISGSFYVLVVYTVLEVDA